MRALRSATALLRGAAGLARAPQCAAPAGAQAAAELARRLDQGCAARHAASAAGDEPARHAATAAGDEPGRVPNITRDGGWDPAGGEAAQAEPLARRKSAPALAPSGETAQAAPLPRRRRAPNVGDRGETTADGKPKPDERTVADLVALGWFATEEEVVALLTRAASRAHRFAFETAKPAADWLEARLGREQVKSGGLHPGAKAVKRFPLLLAYNVATLQRNWNALTLSTEQSGVGIGFSEEQAREAVLKFPQILGYAVDTLERGWSMLTATKGGLGLSPEEARRCILRGPNLLPHDYDDFMRRVGLLESLGYADGRRMVLVAPHLLSYKEEVVKDHAAWWKLTGLDHVKLVIVQPTLLGGVSTEELQAKLDFLSRVAGMSIADLNNACSLFTRSLDGRLRARYFYALLKGRLARFGSINTMMQKTDATFLAMLQGRPSKTKELASDLEVKRYQKLVASAKFAAWRERQEAQRVRDAP